MTAIHLSEKAQLQLRSTRLFLKEHDCPTDVIDELVTTVQKDLQFMPKRFRYDKQLQARKMLIDKYVVGFNIESDGSITIVKITNQKLNH